MRHTSGMQGFFIELKKYLSTYAQYGRDVIFPKNCIGCAIPDTLLCSACAKKIHSAPQQSPLILSACRYEDIVRDIFIAIKIRKEHRYIPLLGDLLWNALNRNLEILEYTKRAEITYIPMHWMKLNMRGFNQSELLARELANHLDNKKAPVALLRRGRLGLRQSSLNKDKRMMNVSGMFLASPATLGKHILLVDDIRTTGATLAAATKALIAAGAKEVRCLTVAQD